MFWYDLKSALRNLKKRKFASSVNGIGLAIGIAFFILLASYIRDETTYDRFHPQADRIYLVTNEFRERFYGGTPHFLAGMLESMYPEVRDAVRLSLVSSPVRNAGEVAYRDIGFADPDFLKMFHFPLVLGDSGSALDDPSRIILTQETARIYFGRDDPLGKKVTILLGGSFKDFLVAGVLAPIPENSSLRFDFLTNYRNAFEALGIDEVNYDLVRLPLATATFLRLQNENEAAALRAKLPALQRKIFADIFQKAGIEPPKYGMSLIRFQDYHLGDVEAVFFEPRSKSSYSLILSGIALLVLLLACFNTTNLALGQAATRLMEIAVRKAVGSRPGRLISYFLTESMVLSLLASVLGLGLAIFLLPPFNALTGKSLALRGFLSGGSLVTLAGLVVFTALAAGGYPAVVLSRQNTVNIFRGRSALGRKGVLSRLLLVLQFAVSLVFVFGTALMTSQLRFLSAKDLGFDGKDVVAVETQLPMGAGKASREMLEFFKTGLRSYPGVVAVAADSGLMGARSGGFGHTYAKDGREVGVGSHMIDEKYLDAMGISLVQGRNFSPEYTTDATDAALVNETLVRSFGLSDPVGKRFSEFAVHNTPKGLDFNPVIIGVVKDFHADSLHYGIVPSAFVLFDQKFLRFRRILVKIRPDDRPETIALIKKTWEKISPDRPFSYEFMDDALDRQYRREQNWGRILKYSAGAAVLIASLGLFGMAALAAARRTKEIGIRKVLGAPPHQIILTLSREFLLMIGLAHLIAWPLAYWAGRRWLETFAYRTGIGLWIFVLSSGLITIVSLLTLSGQAFRAARTDPVKALRHE